MKLLKLRPKSWGAVLVLGAAVVALGLSLGGAWSVADSSHTEEARRSRFAPKGTTPKYAPHTPFQIEHLKLSLKILPQKRWIGGYAQLTISARGKAINAVTLDAAELQISSVKAGGEKLSWSSEKHRLQIELKKPLKPGKKLDIRIDYSATPRSGLHFVLPDKAYPKKPLVVFSQGESTYNRFWFPSHDAPNMRMTSETIITVPKPLMVIANGKLLKRTEKGKLVTYHHKMKYNHVTYLLSLVIGEFVAYKQAWGGIPIVSYVHASQKDMAKRSFENTADMMKFFSEAIGYKYPYSKYVQTTVPDFLAGGMENITATTLTHRTLHDAGAHLYRKSDGLVAHELAHQWFGDLMTCKDWSHIWLNESFATYFAQLYYEHKWGKKAFAYSRFRSLRWYFYSSYKRKIQTRVYQHPSDVFDAHAYPKGAAVLHMIRRLLGDQLWWKAIKLYTTRHAHGLVETADLRRAFEEVSGRNFEPFFDQWIRTPGHPVVQLRYRYHRKRKQLKVTLHQKQKGHVFSFPVKIAIKFAKGQRVVTLDVKKRRESLTLSLKQRPLMVELDPGGDVLMQVKAKKSPQAWRYQLLHGTGLHSRLRAARGLRKAANSPKAWAALTKIMLDPKAHFAVRQAAVATIGFLRGDKGCKLLREAVGIEEARVRSAVVQALGRCRDKSTLPLLAARLRLDASHQVRASAVGAIAQLRHKQSFALLKEALDMPGDYGRIQQAALWGLSQLDDPKALPLVAARMERGGFVGVRMTAMGLYGAMVAFFHPKRKKKAEYYLRIAAHLKDPHPWIRSAAIRGLGALGDWRAIPLMRRYASLAPVSTTARRVKQAIRRIHKQASITQRLSRYGRSLTSLRRRHKKLLRRIKQLERQIGRKQ